ncbi:hypothetical protein N0V88_002690 [Collariella sp. IMI 366227]|nr:hypothetical protein N0V88_002690 [Collariella sp. IMI 366227]
MTEICKSCHDPLVLPLDPEETGGAEGQTVPDDLLLPCGCHFHWQCLLDEAAASTSLDIYPTLVEESYLSSHPEARPARAFHTLAAEGEAIEMMELLADIDSPDSEDDEKDDEDEEDDDTPCMNGNELLLWRDPLNGGKSALHVALEAQQEEAVWLLLWLGSNAARENFPEAVLQVVLMMGLPRRADEEGGLPAEEDVSP